MHYAFKINVVIVISWIFLLSSMPYDGAESVIESIESIDSIIETSESEGCGCGGSGLTRDIFNMNKVELIEVSDGKKVIQTETKKSEIQDDNTCKNGTNIDQTGNMYVFIEGGKFNMGTDKPFIITDGESPMRPVTVSSFYIDKYEVSNNEYLKFVSESGYITDSEKYGWSFVFESAVPVSLKKDITQAVSGAEWWLPVNGSYWREPEGPGSDVFLTNRGDYPAVHISWTDANSYCKWRGGRLPTEAEWEYAVQGRNKANHSLYPWGNKLTPGGKHRTNIFQGKFPSENTADDGFEFLCPVGSLPAQNDYGLHNMIGNVWEWVEDWFTTQHSIEHSVNPTGPVRGREKVKKGGSFLCHRSFCYRYRTVARYATTVDSATQNSGLRCAKDYSP